MFDKSASIYDFIYAGIDYEDEAEKLRCRIRDVNPQARTLLDLGCGSGRHLASFARHFVAQGLDVNPALLAVAQARCPDVRFHCMDMAAFALEDRFDIITCLFSAIGYVRTVERLEHTLAAAARHLNAGGLVLVEPWFTPEQYWTDTITANFVDEPDRKIAWMYTSQRQARLSILDIHYMVGTREGVETFREVHEIGLFTEEEHMAAFRAAGLDVAYDPKGMKRGLYLGRRVP